jgi:hypothetical protein
MKKGFLLGGKPSARSPIGAAMTTSASVGGASATRQPLGPVDNILAAASVKKQKDAGATALRIECDFVTCSQ